LAALLAGLVIGERLLSYVTLTRLVLLFLH
jgi:hypothetical protein